MPLPTFPCSSCAACCLGSWRLSGMDPSWPLRADGACAALVENRCSIYENRPFVCRLDHPAARRASEYIAGHPIPEAEFYPLTVTACVALQHEAGLGPEWAPVLEQP